MAYCNESSAWPSLVSPKSFLSGSRLHLCSMESTCLHWEISHIGKFWMAPVLVWVSHKNWTNHFSKIMEMTGNVRNQRDPWWWQAKTWSDPQGCIGWEGPHGDTSSCHFPSLSKSHENERSTLRSIDGFLSLSFRYFISSVNVFFFHFLISSFALKS